MTDKDVLNAYAAGAITEQQRDSLIPKWRVMDADDYFTLMDELTEARPRVALPVREQAECVNCGGMVAEADLCVTVPCHAQGVAS